ncbi:MAG: carbamoyltransferase HypF [Candidatus Limiplasma sp.]|nr:carbamoyltransferase HypF [Candidatus Limiplasma sp.]
MDPAKTFQSLIQIEGIVQGVGFRPFVTRTARRHGITGTVQNAQGAVRIEAFGSREALEAFTAALGEEKPAPSHIARLTHRILALDGEERIPESFRILPSREEEGGLVMPSPDLAVCGDCLREMGDPSDPRYRNPFISCTHCGPRFSILSAIPYDRPNTSMADFSLCPLCQREYIEVENRRFHAQTVCCNACGPRLFWAGRGREPRREGEEALARAVQTLASGGIVAVKGIGGYHLAVDATNGRGVQALREAKGREAKPFAVMFRDMDALLAHCQATQAQRALLESPARPIVLLPRRASAIVPQVWGASPDLGAFLPYTPLQHLLLAQLPPLVMTSLNRSSLPIVSRDGEALAFMEEHPQVAGTLLHDRPILNPQDDSVMQFVREKATFLRRGRGYVPLGIPVKPGRALALGAQEKSVFTLTGGGYAYPSTEMGDLDTLENVAQYQETLKAMGGILGLGPRRVAYDPHPGYATGAIAAALPGPKVPVYHHHAHIASVMGEHGLADPVIGVAFDGTGFGEDGSIWGGEFLIADRKRFRRAAHLKPVWLLGGDASVRKSSLTAACYRYDAGLAQGLDPLLARALESRVNGIFSSSMGRLFDGVSSLLGICHASTYGGQCAIELNYAAQAFAQEGGEAEPLPYEIHKAGQVDFAPGIRALLARLEGGESPASLAYAFHLAVAGMVRKVCLGLRGETGIDAVCLSGGVFLNRLLTEKIILLLEGEGFRVYHNEAVPAGDGGISFGQAVVALESAEEEAICASRFPES